jgi:hypothetical protein
MAENKSTTKEFGEDIGNQAKFGANEFIGAAQQMASAANQMTEAFAGSRARVGEMMTAVSDAAPRMKRLGADFQTTTNAMVAIADATKKQTLASSDSVAKLYATTQVIGGDIKSIVNSFTNVGIQFGVVGGELEKSVGTVRDLGLNTKEVMGKVLENASALNKFNFEGGVQGLTKMAARAAQLRVDMSVAIDFADKMMDPEDAIKTASAFQRLGVSVGALADPFALMNASINDPGALQDSLAKAAQQFTYFDEKSKTFKINPQGILTLKEMQKQTGVSAAELSKMGLAAAELDKRLSQISPSLKFKDDSDKQFLSNLSEMNASGEYVVKIRDASGVDATKKLSDVTQQEFDNLIKEQKEAPKSMEDIARAGMKTSDIIKNDVGAIKDAVVRGLVSTSFVKDNMESIRRSITVPIGALSNAAAKTEIIRQPADKVIDAITKAVNGLGDKSKTPAQVFQELGDKFKDQSESFKMVLQSTASQVGKEIDSKNLGYHDAITGKLATSAWNGVKDLVKGKSETPKSGVTTATTNAAKTANAKSVGLSSGYGTDVLNKSANPNQTLTSAVDQNIEYSHTGTVTFKIDAPPNIDTKSLQAYVNTKEFQQAVYKGWETVKNEKTK